MAKIAYAGRPRRKPLIAWSSKHPMLREIFLTEHPMTVKRIIAKYAYWIDDEHLRDPALIAVATADKIGKQKPVTEFMKLEQPWSAFGRKVIVNFWERREPKRQGSKRTPIYDRTRTEVSLDVAKGSFDQCIEKGISREVAMRKISSEFEIPLDIIRSRCTGRHASSRRANARLTKLGFNIPIYR